MKHSEPKQRNTAVIAGVSAGAVLTVAAVALLIGTWNPSSAAPTMSPSPTAPAHVDPGHATEKRSNRDAIPEAKVADGAKILDTTDGLIDLFAGNVSSIRNAPTGPLMEADANAAPEFDGVVTATKDVCLLDWAKDTLAKSNGVSDVNTVDVCGSTAAYIIGGFATSDRDMLNRARFNPEHSALSDAIFGPNELGFASVSTRDGEAVLVVAAALPAA